jgi:hypothetical protein
MLEGKLDLDGFFLAQWDLLDAVSEVGLDANTVETK